MFLFIVSFPKDCDLTFSGLKPGEFRGVSAN